MEKKDIEELLEVLWHLAENNESDVDSFHEHVRGRFPEDSLDILELEGILRMEKNKIVLTRDGLQKAKEIIRRHRLAERLLVDVLKMKIEEIEEIACDLEHILAPEILESVCTLLGHPRKCPHGFVIPEGECCVKKEEIVSSAIIPLDKCQVGEKYKVAYLNSFSNSRIHKLTRFGINPGAEIILHQRYPAFVICLESSGQLAMERDVAKEIYVWKNGNGKKQEALV